MSISVAIAAGTAAALAYGVGTAGQHASAYCGQTDARGLAALTRDPRWLIASCCDVLGVVLHIIALANGPVVLIQPIPVLSLPIAILVGRWFGLPKPGRAALINCALVVLGLAVFFALIGQPGQGRVITGTAAGWSTGAALVLGLAVLAATWARGPVARTVALGAVAGCWFGVASVLVAGVSRLWEIRGISGVAHEGLFALAGLAVLVTGAFLLLQMAFQLGPLGASVPVSLVLDPLVAVILGAALLHEHLAFGGVRSVGYVLALGLISVAVFKLAQERGAAPVRARPVPHRTS